MADGDQLVVQFGQTLADDVGVAAYMHIVGVAIPARDNMNVQMVRQPHERKPIQLPQTLLDYQN